jgi:hypothetical protein
MRIRWLRRSVALAVLSPVLACSQTLNLPARRSDALSGSDFATKLTGLAAAEREQSIRREILGGNVPDFLRHLQPVTLRDAPTNTLTVWVTPDYLAIGSNEDCFLMPMRPETAQAIADATGCLLPTRKLVDATYAQASVKLKPAPIAPSPAMTTIPVFVEHNATIAAMRRLRLVGHPLSALVAGHKKDVVITPRLAAAPGKVAIYGWHRTNDTPIQPLYLGHTSAWVDYSHGIRLVQNQCELNGRVEMLAPVLATPKLAALASDEGVIANPRYELSGKPLPRPASISSSGGESAGVLQSSKTITNSLNERISEFAFEQSVRLQLNEPISAPTNQPVKLVLYALPNGNTIEHTAGRKLRPGDDWHFDIQHIAAQTRFVRQRLSNDTVVVAYLEVAEKSWPAWRRKHTNSAELIHPIVNNLVSRYAGRSPKLTLNGHSGGGSFIFGFIDGVERIPPIIERIAFLDSNYAFDPAKRHGEKLAAWLQTASQPSLLIFAYHDDIALLNGKTFVSASGGTWGRSQAMLETLGRHFTFTSSDKANLKTHTSLAGRLRFLLMENPDKAVLHTVQVERNGFIHSLLANTPHESRGYEYFGPRAYTNDLLPE